MRILVILFFCHFANNSVLISQNINSKLPEKDAEFYGGNELLKRFIVKNFRYPQFCIDNNISGKIVVSFLVETNGKLSAISIHQGGHYLLEREAIRLVTSMPKWSPARLGKQKVRAKCLLPINFKLD